MDRTCHQREAALKTQKKRRELWHSQNFIRHSELVRDLLAHTDIGTDDLVVEVGPGKGIITQELIKHARQVIAVEADEDLARVLRSSPLARQANFRLVVADFLAWPLPREPYKVFANIPFNRTAEIVDKLTRARCPPTDAFLIMQEAAAHRFIGLPYQKESLKSILLKVEYEVTIVRSIPSSAFRPRPRVSIVLARFRRREHPLVPVDQIQAFRDFVVYVYTQWQPSVLEALRDVFTPAQRKIMAQQRGIGELKPSELTMDHWLVLFETYLVHATQGRKQTLHGSERRLKRQQGKIEKRHRTRVR